MVKTITNSYYLDKDQRLIYTLEKTNIMMNGVTMWSIVCLTTNTKSWLQDDKIAEMKYLGPNVAPAIRLLYAAAKV